MRAASWLVMPALVMAACGGGSEAATTTVAEIPTTTTVAETTTTTHGFAAEFTTSDFPVPFTLPHNGWRIEESRSRSDVVNIGGFSGPLGLMVSEDRSVDGWLTLLSQPGLEVSEPEAAEVGGLQAVTLMVSAPAGGIGLITVGNAVWTIQEGSPERVWLVEVDGSAVAIFAAHDQAAQRDSWFAEVEESLRALRWHTE